MTTIKVQASYLEKHFQSDMESRGLSDVFDRNYPGTGPYSSGEDFFKYFWQIEEDNLFQKAQNKMKRRISLDILIFQNQKKEIAGCTTTPSKT